MDEATKFELLLNAAKDINSHIVLISNATMCEEEINKYKYFNDITIALDNGYHYKLSKRLDSSATWKTLSAESQYINNIDAGKEKPLMIL